MQKNMQSKGKTALLLLILLLAGAVAAAMLHEPKLVQTPVELALDAGIFKQ